MSCINCFSKFRRINKGVQGLIKSGLGIGISTEDQSKRRREICFKCEFFNKRNNISMSKCQKCNCFIFAKIKLENEKCPMGKW